MKYSIAISFLLLAMVGQSFGALSIEIIPKNPEYPGKCYVEKYKQALTIGETYQVPDKCADMVCDDHYGLTYIECLPMPACPDKWIEKFTKGEPGSRYPGCCDSNECYENEEAKKESEKTK